MKKFLAVLLVFVMCMTLVLTSCTKKSDNLIEVDPDKPTDNPPTGDDPTVDEQLSSEGLIVKRNVAFVNRGATIVSKTQVCKFKCTVCK